MSANIIVLTASLLSCVASTSAPAQLTVDWITQYGTPTSDFGQAITVDSAGRIWVSGGTYGNLGAPNAGEADLFLTRLSPNGSVDFSRQRGGIGSEVGWGIASVGGETVIVGGNTNSPTFDGTPALGGYDAITVHHDNAGVWQAKNRFGNASPNGVTALAGNASHLLAVGSTNASFDGQPYGGSGDAFLSKRESSGALLWTRLSGAIPDDSAAAAAFDNAGNGYLAGRVAGSFNGLTHAGGYDLFVTRYDTNGNRTLMKQLGGAGQDIPSDMEVDHDGNIYLAGFTDGSLGGVTGAGSTDAFVMKLDANGELLWTRLFGGLGEERGQALGLDANGHVWIGGYSFSTFGGHTNVGSQDGFVAEYDNAGNLLGTSWFATPLSDFVNGLAIGPDADAYVTGSTAGSLIGPKPGNNDIFVARITGIPEPSAALLLGGGAFTLTWLQRRRLLERRRPNQ